MKVALVADWLPTFAGAEHVIAEFCRIWPDAPLFATVARHGRLGPLDACDIRTSGLQKWYRILGNYKILLPWMPQAMEQLDLRGFDLIVSSSHAVGKGIIPPAGAVHVCYCHTPMRYAWEMEKDYLRDFGIPKLLQRRVRMQLKRLRRWDLTTAKRTDAFIANSVATAERISRIYDRESTVIPPPVEDRFFLDPLKDSGTKVDYFFAIGRLVPYKRFDLLIEAANAKGFRLKIAGTGQDAARLQRLAGPTVEMLGHVESAALPELYAGAKALLFPQVEDAGVVPLEAQACGTPVIAYGKGGILDTVEEGKTGLFFPAQDVASVLAAIDRMQDVPWNPQAIREHARQFGAARFRQRMLAATEAAVERCKIAG
jgi:glycosyltransferase involved in cell wall biosynthesis